MATPGAWLSGLDWITHLAGWLGDLSGATRALGCPAEQWPDAQHILRHLRQPIAIMAAHYDGTTAIFSVAAGIHHLAWHTLASRDITMLTPAPPSPRGRRW